jgi:hypothetical protein
VTAFLAELGTKLADRWAAALVVPGLLLITAITIAVRLGQSHALDIAQLRTWINSVATSPSSHNPGTLLLAAVGILGAAVTVGLAAAVLGKCVERIWMSPGRLPFGRQLIEWRRRRWRRAAAILARSTEAAFRRNLAGSAAADPDPDPTIPDPGDAIARLHAISLVEPARPTWIADRMRAVDVRVYQAYGLDLGATWPRLWELAPDSVRTDLGAAQDAYSTAARLAGWGLLYVVLAGWWWPAALVAVLAVGTAWNKGRAAVSTLADLAETTVDLYGRDLAVQLGVGCDGPLTRAIGLDITKRIRKE